METGDGLLARVRAPRARLSLDHALALADAAMACGNGLIGLSARANLHLRGLNERTLPELHARLEQARLIDADPEVERLCNIVSSPIDDLDPDAAFDLAQGMSALETRLNQDKRLRRLPAKFSFVLDAKGRLPLGDIDADIRFEARRDGTFAVFLGGEDALSAECPPGETGEIAARLSLAFMALPGSGDAATRRMRALIEQRGAAAVFAAAGCEVKPHGRSERCTALRDILGAQAFGASVVVGAAAAFGEFEAGRLEALIGRARALGATGLRLTPWRAFIIVGLERRAAASMVEACAELGFIVHPDDTRLRIAACPGAPACMHGARPAREDATRWADLLPVGEGVVLHVSGCAKGCARPAATAATLTATADGYDLIIAGKAGDPPARRALKTAEVPAFLAGEGALMSGAGRRL
jgi:precorrin-3B synthase